jgi:hypothetical protein
MFQLFAAELLVAVRRRHAPGGGITPDAAKILIDTQND